MLWPGFWPFWASDMGRIRMAQSNFGVFPGILVFVMVQICEPDHVDRSSGGEHRGLGPFRFVLSPKVG